MRPEDELERFIAAIIGQESGGNYSANNGQAVGRYQILKSNVPAWTKQYLGYSMTWQAFLADHAAQDRVARARLTEYYNKYGPRGAAAAWYSGDPNLQNSTKPQPGGPSIKAYVDSVINRMSTPGVTDVLGPPVPPEAQQRQQDDQGSSLLSWPGDILDFFTSATDDLTAVAGFFRAFFRPSTYVRIAAGGLGIIMIIAGIVFLAKEAQTDG